MKQIHFTTALAACGIALCCCTRVPDASPPIPEQDESSNPHLIPLNSAEIDSSSSGDHTNYNYYLKTITYDKP